MVENQNSANNSKSFSWQSYFLLFFGIFLGIVFVFYLKHGEITWSISLPIVVTILLVSSVFLISKGTNKRR